ncbi:ATP-binding protein [Saccharicrinis sp. FJH2]|uniref:hybrid sensor histidine kinase/response regulator transcription factor n=1 Tax=Saccharicrinis sp. FJH65 TaxID=3344659 RepID=UPI0035F3F7A7
MKLLQFTHKIDAKLDDWLSTGQNNSSNKHLKKYYLYGQIGFLFLTFTLLIFSLILSVEMYVQYSLVCLAYGLVMLLAFSLIEKIERIILITKFGFEVIILLYVAKMGGVLTCGGLIIAGLVPVLFTLIINKYKWMITIFSFYLVSLCLLLVFNGKLSGKDLLTAQQNLVYFIFQLSGIAIYILTFAFYSQTIYTNLERQETLRQKELNEAKTRLYTNITHEFRTPLTVILGLADSLKSNGQNNIPEKANTIIKNGKNLLHLVDQMLDLSKLESGRMLVNKISANIIPFLKYVFQLQEFYAEEKNISMAFSSESQSYALEFDPEKIAAIVSNLLSNAIKFTPEGGQISMKVYHADENICIEIKDNGIGIPSEKLETIFDRFYQVDGANTRKEGGAGIGLAIIHEFVNLLNGSIEVKSNTSLGTIFTVKLPCIPSTEKSIASEALEEENKSWENNSDSNELFDITSNGHHRLLIIEDNPDVIGYLKACYQDHFSIHVAKDGKEGYKLAIDEIPDIVISDIMMPEMDGFELCKKLKDDYRTSHIPIILLTAKADIPSRIEGLETGADAYIVKPFNQLELLVRMQKLLELRRKLFQRYNHGNGLEFSSDPLIQKEDQFIKKLNDIIWKNVEDESFNIRTLCDEMAMSKSQLYRKFRALTNLSVAKYIRSCRMKRAKELLQTTSMNITEISFEVGMKSISTFSRLFKEEFGENPTKYRDHIYKNVQNKTRIPR